MKSETKETTMNKQRRRLNLGVGFRTLLITFTLVVAIVLIPSSAVAQPGSCSAGGSLNPLPDAGLSCEEALEKNEEFDIVYRMSNTSVTVPGGEGVTAFLRGVVTGTLACEGSLCEESSYVESVLVPLPGTLVFVPVGGNGCVANAPGVVGCEDQGSDNEVFVTMTSEGVELEPSGTVDFVTIRVRANSELKDDVCGQFFTRADTEAEGIVIDDEEFCVPGITGAAGGSSLLFFPFVIPVELESFEID